MKINLVVLSILAIIVLFTGCTDTVVEFNDKNLETVIRQEINKPTGDVYLSDVSEIKVLDLGNREITDISALASLTNLESLDLKDNNITDINALANLTKLERLWLDRNNITDISPLADMKRLQKLYISGNQIKDINTLSNLISLEYSDLRRNNIKDITPVSNLTSLDRIWLDGNIVTDFAPLDSLPQIKRADFKKGDYVQFGRYYGEPILWRVIAIEDGKPLLFSDRILTLKAFSSTGDIGNPAGPRADSDRNLLGSNYWKDSTLRHWLNSYKEAGQVFNDYSYNAPSADRLGNGHNPYDQEAGFLANFTQEERNAIATRTHKVLLANIDSEVKDGGSVAHTVRINIDNVVQNHDTANYQMVTDKVFLLSVKELKEYVYDNGIDYIGKPTQLAVDNSTYTWSSLNSTSNWWNWTRSPSASFSSGVRYVRYGDGDVNSTLARYGSGGVRAALSLSSYVINASGSGTAEKPYMIFESDNPLSDT